MDGFQAHFHAIGDLAVREVLDRDVLAATASQICEVRVGLTVADGVVVHRRADPRPAASTTRTP